MYRVKINVLIFYCSPKSFDIKVAQGFFSTIHTNYIMVLNVFFTGVVYLYIPLMLALHHI